MSEDESIRLTQMVKRSGCAAKQPPGYLMPLLGKLPVFNDPNVLVGSNTADDAAIYKLTDEIALVLTTDFFTPIVDRPYDFGAVAAANALSDVYAMAGTPLTALSIVGRRVADDHIGVDDRGQSGEQREEIIRRLLGGAPGAFCHLRETDRHARDQVNAPVRDGSIPLESRAFKSGKH